jgi:hypothetical protein
MIKLEVKLSQIQVKRRVSHIVKPLSFFVATCGWPPASHCEAQRLCFPLPDMQSSRIVRLASAPAGCAVPYSTTRDHCSALKEFSRKSQRP